MIADLLFLMFGAGILAGAGLVAVARNPMVGVLGMLMAFLNASGVMIVMGAEFLGLLLVMVYMGAIAVMFLFVVMTIDIDFVTLREKWSPYLPTGLLVVAVLVGELVLAVREGNVIAGGPAMTPDAANTAQNVVLLGRDLFTTYVVPFQLAGLVLLVAMVGAIVLTHRPRGHVLRQDVPAQVGRKKADVLVVVSPQVGKGTGADVAKHWAPKSVAKPVKTKG